MKLSEPEINDFPFRTPTNGTTIDTDVTCINLGTVSEKTPSEYTPFEGSETSSLSFSQYSFGMDSVSRDRGPEEDFAPRPDPIQEDNLTRLNASEAPVNTLRWSLFEIS